MCGIAGAYALHRHATVDPAVVSRMLGRLVHRGPDDEGTFGTATVVLGHRRLSVIDVAGGHQPLCGARPTTVLVVNGEIYNYRALAEELRTAGHLFRSRSDSEVLAHAYDAWGLDFLDRVDGMFALALWDGVAERLVLARDRIGEKPLYHARVRDTLLFASELTALLASHQIERRLDADALAAYLALEYVPAPASLIAGVTKIEPGTALVLERGTARVHRYWRLVADRVRRMSYGDAVAQLRGLLDRAVHERLVSDVPLGVFLSGGIDSSTVAALAARHGPVDTFSIGFHERSFDEGRFARAVAAHIGSRHHERIIDVADMPALVPHLATVLDEPIGDASILPTLLLSRFARERVTVALGGDGGDELFAGYPMHQAQRVAPVARALLRPVIGPARALAARLPVRHDNFTFGFKVNTFLRGAADAAPLNHALWMSSFSPAEQADLLAADVRRAVNGGGPFAALAAAWNESAGASPLARATHLDAHTYLPNDVLVKVDRASMSVGLEVRSPFLSRAVVEFAFAMPDAYRMKGLTGKRMLRDAVRDLLPAAVLERPKKGFGVPVAAWLTGPLRELARDVLAADALRAAGLFRPAAVQRLLDAHERRQADHRKPLWTLLVFELWRREHLAGFTPALRTDP
jgi:asparagine synthase (glutamine-hydrolysing)